MGHIDFRMFATVHMVLFILFFLVFLIAFGCIIFVIIRSSVKNNRSPRLSVQATVVAKRFSVTHRHTNSTDMYPSHSSTSYYVTFQVESGDRMELPVPSTEYGLFVEGDRGTLHFQGTRFLGFDRQ